MLEQTYTSETELLGDLLGVLSSGGPGDVYGAILNLTYKKADKWEFKTFHHIIGCVVVLREPVSISTIKDILDLRKTKENNPIDFVNFFRRLRIFLIAGADAIDENTIPLLHKSFFEFITSNRAEDHFRVNPDISNGEFFIQSFRQLTSFHQSQCRTLTVTKCPLHLSIVSFPAAVLYSIRFRRSHLIREEGPPSGIAVMLGGALSLDKVREQLRTSLKMGGLGRVLCISSLSKMPRMLTSWDDSIQAWDGKSGQPSTSLPPFEGHSGVVYCVAFSPDEKYIVSGSSDATIHLWDAESGKAIGSPFRGHTSTVFSVAFSPDGMHIISGGGDYTIRLWDMQTGTHTGSPFAGHTSMVDSVAFSPDGAHVVSGSRDKTIRIWNVRSGEVIGHNGMVLSVAFSPDGTHIISGGANMTIRIWNVQSGKAIHSPFQGHTSYVRSVACSPTGTYVVSCSDDKTIRLWDVESGKAIRSLTGHSEAVMSVAFSPDGKCIVSGSDNQTIRLWDVESGEAIRSPSTGHTGRVYSVAFSPDGMHIVSGSHDKTVRLWNAHTGKPSQREYKIQNGYVSSIAVFSASQRVVCASSDGTVQIRDSEIGQLAPPPPSLPGDLTCIASVAASSDEKAMAVVDSNGKVCHWDVESRRLLWRETTLSGPTSLSFSPNSTQLILSRHDGSVFRLDITDGNLKPADIPISPVSTLLPQNSKTATFDMKSGWKCSSGQSDAALHWFPFEDPDAGLWAYVDGKLIRGDGGNSVTIFDVGGDSGNEGSS
jgi:WD40 repeat protein